MPEKPFDGGFPNCTDDPAECPIAGLVGPC